MNNYFLNGNTGKIEEFDVHKVPEFKIENQKDWVIWGTDREFKNRQPDYYDWLYNSSSKHRASLDTKVRFLVGKGLELSKTGLNLQEEINSKAYLKKLTSQEFVKKISTDLTHDGGFCYELVFSKDGKEALPHHVPFGKVRRSKPTFDKDGKEEDITYWFTKNWKKLRPQDNPDWTEFEEFKGEASNEKRFLIYFKIGEDLYPLPEYTAAIPYIAADYEVSNFVYNNTKEGFTGSMLVNFYNGEPSEDQKREIEVAWHAWLHGSDNAGKGMLNFNEEGDTGVTVTPLPSNGSDDRYINLNKQIREEIYSGHVLDPIIVGLPTETGFNNNADEKRVATASFQSSYIDPWQILIEDHLNTILHFNELKGQINIIDLDQPQDQVSETELALILTVDERRDRAGFPVGDQAANPVADALATISPLVATKVLEAMSIEEIRAIVGLVTTGPIERRTETLVTEFSKQKFDSSKDVLQLANYILAKKEDEAILNHLEVGVEDDDYILIARKELQAYSIEEAEDQANTFKFITIIEQTILNLIKGTPNISNESLAKITGLSEEEVAEIVEKLEDEGLLEDGEVTSEGEEELREEEIITVYKYVKRVGTSGGDIIDGSRNFCKRLIRLSRTRSWTIEQIRGLNNGQGLDVFTSRGGWFRQPNGVSRPSCRHVWEARLVKRKNA